MIAAAVGEPAPSNEAAAARFAAIGIGGALALVAIGLVFWRSRLGPVRKRLVHTQSTDEGK